MWVDAITKKGPEIYDILYTNLYRINGLTLFVLASAGGRSKVKGRKSKVQGPRSRGLWCAPLTYSYPVTVK